MSHTGTHGQLQAACRCNIEHAHRRGEVTVERSQPRRNMLFVIAQFCVSLRVPLQFMEILGGT